jgi:light-regulated signal transduction histidine kinase (bacteriophytochrome)
MQQLIDDLLSLSRVNTGAEPHVQVDLQAVVADAIADLTNRIGELGATVRVDTLPVLTGDRTQLLQVFTNLLRNALTFVADGTSPDVHVCAERHGGGWQFAVADNGIGIPPEHRQRVFGMFKRLHARDLYAGTGIGLAIVAKVTQRHGGRCWIEDNPGGGSRLVFTIPDPQPA